MKVKENSNLEMSQIEIFGCGFNCDCSKKKECCKKYKKKGVHCKKCPKL